MNTKFSTIKTSKWLLMVPVVFVTLLFAASCSKDEGTDSPIPIAKTDTITQNIDVRTVLPDIGQGIDYYIGNGIEVYDDLIIEPGVKIIMSSESFIYIASNGSLNAVGTAQKPITFSGEVATPGYWDALSFDSNNPNNRLEYVRIKHAGYNDYGDENSSVWVSGNSAQLTIKNSSISYSKRFGLLVENGGTLPGFSSNTFSNNGDAALKIPASIIGAMDVASNYADNNVNNYIYVDGADINQDQTVKATNVPYFIQSSIEVYEGLTLNPGVTFLMGTEVYIYVHPTGFINAIGTAADPITIKGKVESVGYWDAIAVASNNPQNEFAFVEVKHGGADDYGDDNASLFVDSSSSFILNNCEVSNSYGWGLFAKNGATLTPSTKPALLNANTFTNNGTGTSATCSGNCNIRLD